MMVSNKKWIRHRIAVVMGTRPEAIKLAPLVLALRRSHWVECLVCVTAQHRQMLDQVLEVFEIEPDADLNLMRANQTLSDFTARALVALDDWLGAQRPDLVLVQGDTTTAFVSALAAFYRHIPVGHVEAGLRTGDLTAPWPEEANRVLTSRLAALHFAPTDLNRANLRRESIPAGAIHVTGNTVIDALYLALNRVRLSPRPLPGLPEALQPRKARGKASTNPRVVLITGHRRESFGEGFEQICRAIAQLAAEFPEVHFVYPVHLNPNVREPVMRILGGANRRLADRPGKETGVGGGVPNVHLIEPLSYLSFVALMARSCLVLTDSGGIQEEAPSLGKPVLVMRATTERPEGVRSGTVQVVGTQTKGIVESARRLLVEARKRKTTGRQPNPYGDGKASARIVKICLEYLRRRAKQGGGS
jgi:UDP-N-acetylglucosamine 2-epimerase (non-hydrolysing)